MHVGFLDDGDQRPLRRAPMLQEDRKIGALAQLRDLEIDGAGARLPGAITVAVAMVGALSAALVAAGIAQAVGFQLHQPVGGKPDHLVQQIGVGGLLKQRLQLHPLVGHCGRAPVWC